MSESNDKHLNTYQRMLENVKTFLDEAEKEYAPKIQYGIDSAKDKAAELEELTREEIDKLAEYLQRDLEDAGQYLQENGKELSDWLKFDIELIEDRIIETFAVVADQTKLELAQLAQGAIKIGVWKTGEITGIGTLVCKACGEEMNFHKTGHIPACPKCKAEEFGRPVT